ncbi:MAG TPA: gamma-glutamylcyclotransferase family protein [Moraxellaceae bacterium]|nr:gamma-glutamylcyclotransferase family protein [Moraxellaceae bacterium]
MTQRDTPYLFVYGTLRRGSGHAMGAWLAARAEWVGTARCGGARLYRVSWYPALAAGRPDEAVAGDVYRLPDAGLWPALDDFEGVAGTAGDEYERRLTMVALAAGGTVRAWCYWYRLAVAGLVPVAGGDWLAGP